MLTQIGRWLRWLVQTEEVDVADALDMGAPWHGDHWHNLLCSPMDARHYVMEDWSLPRGRDVLEQGTEWGRGSEGQR